MNNDTQQHTDGADAMKPTTATKFDRAAATVLVWTFVTIVLACLLAIPVLLILWLGHSVGNLPSWGTFVNALIFSVLLVFGVTIAFYCGARAAARHTAAQQPKEPTR